MIHTFEDSSVKASSAASKHTPEFQAPDLQPENSSLCCYRNCTSSIQVVRIPNLPEHQFERVVFPGQRLLFEAPAWARLEVYTGGQAGALLADSMTCDRIQISS